MKTEAFLLTLALLTPLSSLTLASPMGTAFTYQGKLTEAGAPASGIYDFRFAVWDASTGGNTVGGPLTNHAVNVAAGLFTVVLDFGGNVFMRDQARWLEISVCTNGSGAFGTLAPRQAIRPSPYAIWASGATMASAALGVVNDSVFAPGIATNQVVKSLNGLRDNVALAAGANVTLGTNGNTLTLSAAGGGATGGWSTTGNAGTGPSTNFLGTIDNKALELRVNGQRALRLEPTTNDLYHRNMVNLVGGSPGNYIAPGVFGSVIAGGGTDSGGISAPWDYFFGSLSNSVYTDVSVLCGGVGNSIKTNAMFSFLGGGLWNSIGTNSWVSFLGVGRENRIQENADYSFLGGGGFNSVQAGAYASFLGGGLRNTNGGSFSVVPGGSMNVAGGPHSLAAGHRAKALHPGALVWADSTQADFTSTGDNQFGSSGNFREFFVG